ncbi:N-acetylmannosamine-6-phosphate 2-epimerase [Pseudomonas mucidolens]|uniref:Putative N-acetylmannosamine-6-phosphate 2-epimerase n=1 Tax=Pseudomonas mucidolens TaxID=46679 RepID=A0A1H2M6W5_9PSED|nr:N-acetylmannosamine-6-phosphate 2-epimerase [Pseudomonas mucidolens]SDU88236.1 N-acylglucosamine-6-phosphate 2-epimerase [Pseudomonas mucidolens]SQH34530.1 Putative N-acetylmannosamine-6-phosphate 2-epimerase [Pseudomonas mucidolens]
MFTGSLFDTLMGGLIVSCQALEHEPLHGSTHMSAMALAAAQAGAVGIIANGIHDISAIKKLVTLPIIGVMTAGYSESSIQLTPTIVEITALAREAPDMIGLDATDRRRPNGESLEAFVEMIRSRYPNLLLMAEVATVEEAIYVQSLKFDCLSTAAYGATKNTAGKSLRQNDFSHFTAIRRVISQCPLVAEGGIGTPEHARRVLQLGADIVVVGSAITRPQVITESFVNAMVGYRS